MLAKTPRVLFVFFNTNSSLFFFLTIQAIYTTDSQNVPLTVKHLYCLCFYNKLIIVSIVL